MRFILSGESFIVFGALHWQHSFNLTYPCLNSHEGARYSQYNWSIVTRTPIQNAFLFEKRTQSAA